MGSRAAISASGFGGAAATIDEEMRASNGSIVEMCIVLDQYVLSECVVVLMESTTIESQTTVVADVEKDLVVQ
jgi:hypothetical protein